jgi:GMP synthase (glutamine-hydrolysing)
MNAPTQPRPTAGRAEQLHSERVLVLDFGSQFAQLIARRVRDENVYCEIVRHDISAETIVARKPSAIILSGGPSSVYDEGAPRCDPKLFTLGIPILGICYGDCNRPALGFAITSISSSSQGSVIANLRCVSLST